MVRERARRIMSAHVESPAVTMLARLGVSPNAVTLSGLAIAAVCAFLLSAGWLLAGGAVLLLSGVLDLLDGALARATGRASRWGALLDSVTDRVSEAVVLLGLAVYYLDRGPSWGVALVFAALAGSYMVSYVRARSEGLGVDCKVGVATRPERVVGLAAGLMVGQWWGPAVLVAVGAIAALTALTTVQRVLYVRRALARADGS